MLTPGDVVEVDLGVPSGSEAGLRRPAVVVTAARVLRGRPNVVQVVSLTRSIHESGAEVLIEADDRNGLVVQSSAQCQHVRSVATARIGQAIGNPGPIAFGEVRETLAPAAGRLMVGAAARSASFGPTGQPTAAITGQVVHRSSILAHDGSVLPRIAPTLDERSAALPGDTVVPAANVVMDRAFTVPGTPAQVWPWLQQLGKQRAGWYLSARLERFLPRRRRAIRHVDDRWQHLKVGDVVPDYGPNNSFTVADIAPGEHLVYTGTHDRLVVSWAIVLTPVDAGQAAATRIRLRLRLGHVRRTRLARTLGGAVDAVTVAWLAEGLRDRLR